MSEQRDDVGQAFVERPGFLGDAAGRVGEDGGQERVHGLVSDDVERERREHEFVETRRVPIGVRGGTVPEPDLPDARVEMRIGVAGRVRIQAQSIGEPVLAGRPPGPADVRPSACSKALMVRIVTA